jgi:MFS family permease
MTHDPLALGLVVALMGVPRALFILFGGALVDRYSPKRVLLLTKYANTVLLGVLAALVLSGAATLPLVGTLALAIGVASAFSIPSGTSVLPQVVEPGQLQLANGVMMSIRQLTMLAGPLLAGLLFALAGDGSAGLHDAAGLGLAFGLDAISFAASAWTLSKVATHAPPPAAPQPILRAIGAALGLVWNDATLRTCFLYWGVCACVVGGIMQVAMPVLASTRLHGAAALGMLMGAYGAGTLAGMALTSVTGNLRIRNLGTTLLLIDALIGAALLPLGHVGATWHAVLINLAVGVLGGFMQVAVFTWIQQRVPRAMLGRMMSIFMFIFLGLAPLGSAFAGWMMKYTALPALFSGAGLFLVGAAVLAYVCTPMRAMADAPAGRQG